MKSAIKKWLTGLTIPQEYVCVEVNNFQKPLTINLILDEKRSIDVTTSHLFLGYKPLIIGLPQEEAVEKSNDLPKKVTLSFEMAGHFVASLSLKKIKGKNFGSCRISFYEGKHGLHIFLNQFNQWINSLREKIRIRPPGNISLPGNLLEQVRIAYSIPRIISVVTIFDGEKANMFPTDLHGPLVDQFYLSSLRINGKANEQVEKFRRIVISRVSTEYFKEVYQLGRNHMADLKSIDNFSLHSQNSKHLSYPLPVGVQQYFELEQIDSLDFGIHRIHLYKVLNYTNVESNSTLGHIHQYFAQWRQDKGIPTPMFFR